MAGPLHVTNGDSTLISLAASGLSGEAIAWRDALWVGPVPAGPPDAVRAARAAFVEEAGWAGRDETAAMMRDRDAALEAALGAEPVTLWFEHDLYDQLQLLQVLTFVGDELADSELLQLIVIDAFPGRPDFRGLGELSAEELASLWPLRRLVGQLELARARRVWEAFTAGDVRALEAEAGEEGDGLVLLGPALRRLLEELPGVRDGLSRSERQLLQAVAEGARDPIAAFLATQDMEEAPFAGDRQIFDIATRLAYGSAPLLRMSAQEVELSLTPLGEEVLAGRADAVRERGVDRWIGGLRLQGTDVPWRWDAEAGRIAA